MADKEQQITVEEMFGIAKKFALQLKAFPLETESAIVEMVRVSMQHRSLQEQKAHGLAEMAIKERHAAMQEQQMELARMAQQRLDAGMVPTGISGGRARAVTTLEELQNTAKQLAEHEMGVGHTPSDGPRKAVQELRERVHAGQDDGEIASAAARLVEEPVSG